MRCRKAAPAERDGTMEWEWTASQVAAKLAMFRLMKFLEKEPVFNNETHHAEHAPKDGRTHNFRVIPDPKEGLTFLSVRLRKHRKQWLAVTATVGIATEPFGPKRYPVYRFRYTKGGKFQDIVLKDDDPMAYLHEWELEPSLVD